MALLCSRCGDSMTLHVVGERHCQTCRRELAQAERRTEPRPWTPRWLERSNARDLTGHIRDGAA